MTSYYEETRRANVMISEYVPRIKKGEHITTERIIREVTEKHAVSERAVRKRIALICRLEKLDDLGGDLGITVKGI